MRDARAAIAADVDATISGAGTTAHVRAIRGARRAVKRGGAAIVEELERAVAFFAKVATTAIVAAAVTAYLEGAAARRRRFGQLRLSLLEDAAARARARARMTPEQVEEIRERVGADVATAVGAYADDVNARLRAVVARGIRENLHEQDLAVRIGRSLRAAGVSERPYRLRQMARDQVNMNFMAARLKGNDDPAVQDVLWGYEYVSVDDDRVRPSHALLNGVRLPKEHPFWRENMPPNGYNCRCTVVEVFKEDRPRAKEPPKSVRYAGKLISPGADEGWRFNPAQVVPGPRARLDVAVRCEERRCRQYLGEARCEAFPDGIPEEIAHGDNDHTRPYPGDRGLRYERRR